MATQNKLTHNGTKKATHTTVKGAEFYFSRPAKATKRGTTFLNVSGINPTNGKQEKVRLNARQLNSLKAILAS